MKGIFWDVDTQKDFIFPHGKLPVPHATEITPNLKKLTDFAREKSISVVMSMDTHNPTDPEISDRPDFKETFPPHCIRGTDGWEKIPETSPRSPLYVESDLHVDFRGGEIIILKSRFDVFSNPNTDKILAILDPEIITVYGVATDVCVRHAVEGFLRLGRKVAVAVDAVRAINPGKEKELFKNWEKQGVKLLATSQIVGS